MNRDERIVVVGGGLTGLRAAERLRELKFEGEITILGDEKLPPYHRPALSKQLLKGELRSSDLTLPAYEDLNARWRFGTQVRQLIPNKKTLVLPGGEEMTYDGLVIATGVEATKQNGVPYHDPRVLVLRTMSDGLDLERVLGSTKGRVAVIGGGFTGCELAASLRHLSREVTLIGRGKNLLGNVLGPELGDWLTNTHREHGVDLALGNSVEEWNPTAEGIGLKLTDGSTLMVSCVILAAGTKPMTHWLRGSGLPLDNGVVCEPTCHVVGAEDVVAAGDVAQWPNLRFDNVPRRVEHWLNAVEMGRAAAENLLAGREAAEPFAPMPRFWTDQYSYRIQAAGMIKLGKDIVKLGTPDEGTGTVYGYSLEGRLMAVAGVDCPSAMIAWAESLSRQNPEPRPRVEVETKTPAMAAAAAGGATTGGFSKKPRGKHSAPPQGKQPQRKPRPEHEIGYVEESPAEVSASLPIPVGVGTGAVPAGRPMNVVDSFSRMLPVAVRPPGTGGPPNGRPPVMPPNGRSLPGGPPSMAGGVPPMPSGQMRRPAGPPPNGGGPRGPINAPFGDGASTSGTFNAVNKPPANGFAGGPPKNAAPVSGIPTSPFGAQNGRPPLLLGPATSPVPAQVPPPPPSAPPPPPPLPEFKAADMTAPSGFPEPLSGRNPNLPIDVTGQMALLDANGHTRAPDFSDKPPRRGPSDSFSAMPPVPRGGPMDSFNALPPARRGNNGRPPARGPQDSFSSMPPVRRENGKPVAGGPQDSFSSMPPVRRENGKPVAGGPQDSFSSMPPVRRENGKPVAGGPQDSFSSMPPVRRENGKPVAGGPQDSFSSMPPVRRENGKPVARGPQDSFSSMPPVRRENGKPVARGPQDSFGSLPLAPRDAMDSFSSLPPVRRGANGKPVARGPEESFGGLPPVPPPPPARRIPNGKPIARGPEESFNGLPPARRTSRGPEDSYSGLPPARRSDSRPAARRRDDSFSARDSEDSYVGLPPARRSVNTGRSRDPETSVNDMPPVTRHVDDAPRRSVEDSYSALPPARRGAQDSFGRMPAVRGPLDPYGDTSVDGALPAASDTGSRSGRRRADDSYSALPAVSDDRRGSHRAEDLTPEFGRPPTRRRTPEPDLSSLRLVPALSSMDDSIEMPPVRMPKHGRPEDYGQVPPARGGPEDSYDRMPAIERSGGRRRRA